MAFMALEVPICSLLFIQERSDLTSGVQSGSDAYDNTSAGCLDGRPNQDGGRAAAARKGLKPRSASAAQAVAPRWR